MDAIPLGRVLGIPLFASWSAFFILALVVLRNGTDSPSALATGLLYGVAVFGSILVHELGHAIVGRRLGLRPQGILLHGFGGLCQYGRSPRPSEGVYSSAAGPAAGLALGVVAWVVNLALGGMLPHQVGWLLKQLVWINIFWSLFNLLPMYPLDGGHLLWYGLRLKVPGGRAWKITRWVGIATAVLVALGGLATGMTFVLLVAGLSLMELIRKE